MEGGLERPPALCCCWLLLLSIGKKCWYLCDDTAELRGSTEAAVFQLRLRLRLRPTARLHEEWNGGHAREVTDVGEYSATTPGSPWPRYCYRNLLTDQLSVSS
jgi:hypothetical protein